MDKLPLFGCLRNGEMVLRGPNFHGPIFAPESRRPVEAAAWLRQTLTVERRDESRYYSEVIVMIPGSEADAETWENSLMREGFEPISRARYLELRDPLWQGALGPWFDLMHSSIWIYVRPVVPPPVSAQFVIRDECHEPFVIED